MFFFFNTDYSLSDFTATGRLHVSVETCFTTRVSIILPLKHLNYIPFRSSESNQTMSQSMRCEKLNVIPFFFNFPHSSTSLFLLRPFVLQAPSLSSRSAYNPPFFCLFLLFVFGHHLLSTLFALKTKLSTKTGVVL